jgi:hypothetical protein
VDVDPRTDRPVLDVKIVKSGEVKGKDRMVDDDDDEPAK